MSNYDMAKYLVDEAENRAGEAQVYATLALVDELRAIRELLEEFVPPVQLPRPTGTDDLIPRKVAPIDPKNGRHE